jgi:hypothetical protein
VSAILIISALAEKLLVGAEIQTSYFQENRQAPYQLSYAAPYLFTILRGKILYIKKYISGWETR